MINSFVKIPELTINRHSLLSFVLNLKDDDWILLPWGQYIFYDWKNCDEIKTLSTMFSENIKFSTIECMRFDGNKSLPIHMDGKRTTVIQIPLSLNCNATPTLFYNDHKELVDKIEWLDDSAWMFDTHKWHSVHNTSTEPRYTLCISFYGTKYIDLLKLYQTNNFFQK
jgi:hypothetical protein